MIPDGADKNLSLVDGAAITFQQNESGEWIPFYDGNALSGQGAPIFFSEQSLNADGVDHMNHSGDGEITLGFEDLRGGGDNDFNDVIVNLNIREINADPEPFTLGGRDVPRNDYDVDNLWNQELAGYQVAVTPYSHLDNKVEGQFGFEYKGDIVRGIGVKGGDPEIHGNEGISIDFGGLELKSVTVGLRALFQEGAPPDNVETASWKAFKSGEEVASGEIDAVSSSNDGKVESIVEVANGFDELVFFTEESGSDY
ncbi:MAG: DUF4114 domain-containing protein, partial [Phycisphaerales bacterium]|nr:DUF4114 domain-containing protein [Phycisphaerales bacterium]